MTDILAKRNHEVLARYASSNLLVAFDYDGTLAPIVDRPARADMRAITRPRRFNPSAPEHSDRARLGQPWARALGRR
jgi:hypothetical protein